MDLRPITETYAVAPQITVEDIAGIVDAGYKSIMCNRPDGEEYGQTDFAEIEAAAKTAGLETRWVPIISGMLRPGDLEAFDKALDELPTPMLAYCRTGTRCTMLWTVVQHGRLPNDTILSATSQAGYDMSGLLAQISQQG